MSIIADRFTVVLDTDVLVGVLTRNILLTYARAGFFRPRWSTKTIDEEFVRIFARLYPDAQELGALQRSRIVENFPECQALHDPKLIEVLELPDPDDRHVLAAAIQTKAAVIVTNNLRDFPKENIASFEVEAKSADDFIADCIDLYGPEAVVALRTMRERFRKPALDAEALLLRMEEVGLSQTALLLDQYKAFL